MADIGEPLRIIEVEPMEIPEPQEIPVEPVTVPEKEKELEPV